MAAADSERARIVAREVWDRHGIKGCFTGHGGWSFNRHSPEDADSTAWSLRFALALGLQGRIRVTMGEDFLRGHITGAGGIATFRVDAERLHHFLQAPDVDLPGWMGVHTCVTAAAACVPAFTELLVPWLLARQHEDGRWDGYWWEDPQYTTSLAVEALGMSTVGGRAGAMARAARWTASTLDDQGLVRNDDFPDGSPFATALAVRTLLLARGVRNHDRVVEQAVRRLMAMQRGDGSWQPSARLRVPPPTMVTPENQAAWRSGTGLAWGTWSLDQHALFTTATVLGCLVLAQQQR